MVVAVAMLRRPLAELLRRGPAYWVPALCVLVNGVAFMVFREDSNAYTARGRTVLGVALAAAMCMPALKGLGERATRWQIAGILLWVSMLPVIAVYGLTEGTI